MKLTVEGILLEAPQRWDTPVLCNVLHIVPSPDRTHPFLNHLRLSFNVAGEGATQHKRRRECSFEHYSECSHS